MVRMKTTPAVGADVDAGHGVLALVRMRKPPKKGTGCSDGYRALAETEVASSWPLAWV